MKTKLIVFFLVLGVIIFWGCNKNSTQNTEPILNVSTTFLDFGSDLTYIGFNIYNSGGGTLNWNVTDDQDWITVEPTSGSDDGVKSTVNVIVSRTDLLLGDYQGEVSISSNGGSAIITILMEVEEEFVLTLNNPLFTDIDINVTGHNPVTIESETSAILRFPSNPESIIYHAETSYQIGTNQIGLLIEWDQTYDVSDQSLLTVTFDLSSEYVFFYLQISSDHYLTPFYVNYDSEIEMMVGLGFPNNGTIFPAGYYQAFENMEVRAYWEDNPGSFYNWIEGTDFVLPFNENQSVTLVAP